MEYAINKIVSPELRVPDLKQDQVAIYKLCDADLVDHSRVDERGRPQKCQPRRSMVGSIMIQDPINRKRVKILNVVGIKHEETSDGTQREVPVVQRVVFPHTGVLSLTEEHNGTYQFMERHPHNRDNPFRDKNAKAKFYRVDAKKSAIRENENNYILSDALQHIKNADLTELKAIYEKLDETSQRKVNMSGPFEQIKRDMFELTKEHPVVVMRASNNKDAKRRIQIMDAEYFNIITFLEDEEDDKEPRRWVFTSGSQEICTVDLTKNKIDGLAEFFVSSGEDGKAAYRKMTEGLKKILAPKQAVTT